MSDPKLPTKVQAHLVASSGALLLVADRLLDEATKDRKLGDLRPFAAAVLVLAASRAFDVAMTPRV